MVEKLLPVTGRITYCTGYHCSEVWRHHLKRVSLPQLSQFGQLLLTVSSGKADLTFTEPADAAVFLKNNPGTIERVGPPVRVFPNCWIFRRGQSAFKNMIDTTLSQLVYSGEMDKIIRKYETLPDNFYHVAVPYLNPAVKH